jgi:hypothetical protein
MEFPNNIKFIGNPSNGTRVDIQDRRTSRHAGRQAGRQTDMTKLMDAFAIYANVPNRERDIKNY